MRNLAGEQCIFWKFLPQRSQQLQRSRLILLAHIRNREQDSRKRCEVVSTHGGGFEVGNSTLLVRGQPSQAENPAHRGDNAPDNVFAEAGRQQGVVAVGTHRKQLLRRGRRCLGEAQRRQIALFDERRVVGLQTRRQGQGKQCISILGILG